ncbi:MAG: hypothetical protein AAF399_22975 [Bacteroidota bacterium]
MSDSPAPFEIVEQYVLGEMNSEAQHEFENRLASDSALQQMVAQVRAMHQALGISPEQLKNDPTWKSYQTVREAGDKWAANSEALSEGRILSFRWIIPAAAALALLLLGIWWWNRPVQPAWKQIAQQEMKPYPNVFGGIEVRSSATDSATFIQMIRWYQEQEYDSSLMLMNEWLETFADSAHLGVPPCEIQFYRGQAHWQNQDVGRAFSDWRLVIEKECKRFIPEAEWYLALAYLAEERSDSAKVYLNKIVQDDTHPYQDKCRTFLELLE